MSKDRITMDEINKIAEKNPDAASLVLGMQLMADSAAESSRIVNNIIAYKDERITELERQIEWLRPLAERYLQIRAALAPPVEYDA